MSATLPVLCGRLRGLVLGACVAALAVSGCGGSDTPERIVLIVVDTLRRDFLSCYGAKHPTPHIDALARRGRAYRHANASYHQTSMSMASLFTGRTPSLETVDPATPLDWNGSTWCGLARFSGVGDEGLCIPAALPTLPQRLGEAGYWTIGVVSNDFLYEPSGFGRGFADFAEVGQRASRTGRSERRRAPEHWATRTAGDVNRAADLALARRESDRFFLYVHYMEAHDYGFRGRTYADGVKDADRAVGALIARLDSEELLRDAVVILTSDHGERLGETHPPDGRTKPSHTGNPSFQELLRVPLVVAPALPELDALELVRTQDLYSVILRLAGLDAQGPDVLGPSELFLSERRFRTYRSGRYKSTIRRRDGRFMLFDLSSDPHERRDVAKAHPEVVASHRSRVDELSRALAAGEVHRRTLSDAERQRLEALGYLE